MISIALCDMSGHNVGFKRSFNSHFTARLTFLIWQTIKAPVQELCSLIPLHKTLHIDLFPWNERVAGLPYMQIGRFCDMYINM